MGSKEHKNELRRAQKWIQFYKLRIFFPERIYRSKDVIRAVEKSQTLERLKCIYNFCEVKIA